MSFDTNYPNRKDKRAPYMKSGRFDASCRPGGGCPYCEGNRRHALRRRLLSTDEQVAELHEVESC